ncbi:hypothetical protein BC962_3298 [Gillisia mitskevichiae]|uniref:Uncharacterized protein n=1 Tax=Gillisia mitskevichiae TaxID=270921 RepID=A0A495NVQ2_9FLAO|nr:hypothetical protein [Gillisia mitskevichiae]RKS42484.1 hypothetical protein BC962_3298 [Gillisia mitskevichiae]
MVNIILAIAFIILGTVILIYYNGLKKEEKGGLTFKLIGAGIGFIIIGLGLIIRELL